MDMMRNLSWKRVANIAMWDMNINRQAYVKYALFMVGVYVMIAMYSYVAGFLSGSAGAFSDAGFVLTITAAMGSAHTLQTMLLMSTMFHGLRTRQGRVNELTLPASNQEKFLWHVIRTVAANWVTFAAGVVLADVLHVIFVMSFYGTGVEISSITVRVCRLWTVLLDFGNIVGYVDGAVVVFLPVGWFLMSRAIFSTFALGSAWKYRRSFVNTLLFHIALWLILLVGVLTAVSFQPFVISPQTLINLRFLIRIDSWLWAFVFMAFASALFFGVWVLTYRLYVKAQITSVRNP